VDRSERALLSWLLRNFPNPRRVLEVGCGTAHFTRWLAATGGVAIGLDRSPGMLSDARRRGKADLLVLGDAQQLPLRDGGVDLTVLVTTVEFLDSPLLALAECARISERGLVLVVLNRWSAGGLSRRWGRQSRTPLLARARDMSLSELRRLLADAAGRRLRRLECRSALLPRPVDRWVTPIPLGDVIGAVAELSGPCPRDPR
jgi:ubiquinone/menaquinone biosynthesis C-methylase UbiE